MRSCWWETGRCLLLGQPVTIRLSHSHIEKASPRRQCGRSLLRLKLVIYFHFFENLENILPAKIVKKTFEKMSERTLSAQNFFWYIFSDIGVQKRLKKHFEPKGHFWTFFRKNFWFTILSGKSMLTKYVGENVSLCE